MDGITRERLMLPIAGGALAVTTLAPSGRRVRASIVINCAMSVKQAFYFPFAQFLAAHGYSVTTWDYRGVGESILERMAARQVTLDQWAREDLTLVIAVAAESHPELPIVVIGHSFGGQIIALARNRDRICGALLIACPSGYVGHWRGRAKGVFMWCLAYLALPLLTRLCGRFPAARLGLGANLPRRVALQWGSWLRHPRYIAGCADRSARMASFDAPVHAIALSDDEFAPPGAVEAMLALYSGSAVSSEVLVPAEHGLQRIGHMGFFRTRSANRLWTIAADRVGALARHAGSNGRN